MYVNGVYIDVYNTVTPCGTLVSKRIMTARFYFCFRRLSVIQVYTPHNERKEKEKDHCYEELQQTIDGCNSNEILVVMGDFNA